MNDGTRHGVKNSRMDEQSKDSCAIAKKGMSLEEPAVDLMLASMQPAELKQAMDHLGCNTQSALAILLGVDRSTVSLWLEGRIGVPRPIAKLLRLLMQYEDHARPSAP